MRSRFSLASIIAIFITILTVCVVLAQTGKNEFALIPAGQFEMGDHHNFVDPSHPSDEGPIHTVRLSSFYIGKTTITVQQYCDYLNSALSQGQIRVVGGLVYAAGANDIFFQTRQADQFSRIGWDGSIFAVLDNKGDHPITSVMWFGAAAYCNWLSIQVEISSLHVERHAAAQTAQLEHQCGIAHWMREITARTNAH